MAQDGESGSGTEGATGQRSRGTHLLAALGTSPQRVRDIAALRGLGYTFSEIGGSLGVTPQAVAVMLTRYRRALKPAHDIIGSTALSARAINALSRHGITHPADPRLEEALEAMRHERNCGAKTIDGIRRWAQSRGNGP